MEDMKYTFSVSNGWLYLEANEIVFFKASDVYTELHTADKQYFLYHSLKEIEERLPETKFFRCHKSYMINLDKIKMIRTKKINQIETTNGEIIPVSRSRKKELLDKMRQLYGTHSMKKIISLN